VTLTLIRDPWWFEQELESWGRQEFSASEILRERSFSKVF
jgi:hypothetical protein